VLIRWMKKSLPLLLVFALLVFSFSSAVSASRAESAQHEYSGKEIFKGIVFGVGELGGKLPVDSRIMRDTNKNQETLKVIDNIVNEIERLDSDYFKELKDTAYSKNPTKVDKAIERGGDLVQEALDNLGYTATSKQDADLAASVVVANITGAINALAYLTVAVYEYVWFWGNSAPSSQLEKEAYVIEVMEALEN